MVNPGRISQIIGPVIDVEFEDDMPPINEKLVIEETGSVLEVLAHEAKGSVRCISMSATDGLSRGMKVLDTGGQISVPVGEGGARQGAQRARAAHRQQGRSKDGCALEHPPQNSRILRPKSLDGNF